MIKAIPVGVFGWDINERRDYFMNALDYLFRGADGCILHDEAGNMCIDYGLISTYSVLSFLDSFEHFFAASVDYKKCIIQEGMDDILRQYEIAGSDIKYFGNVRKPYYRLRGKPVTKEQAFDIVRRTDLFMNEIDGISKHADFIKELNFSNNLISKNSIPNGNGWVHTDGTVGVNDIMSKFPSVHEFVFEWLYYLIKFPYLDLTIAVTDWNEAPPAAYEYDCNAPWSDEHRWESPECDDGFYNAVVLGIHVHDKTIEILKAKDAVRVYKEYASLYEKNWEINVSDYYMANGINQVDMGYLRRCIESYGLNADEALGKVPEYTWKGRD